MAVSDTFAKNGIISIALPADVDSLRQQFIREMCFWLERIAKVAATPGNLSTELVALAGRDRALVGKLYKVSRRFPSVRQLASHSWFVALAGRLMNTELVSCCTFVNVRIDLPQEERYLTPIHQDFPYIQGSLNAVTFWIPFFDTTLPMGPPSWIPGSHKWGVLKVEEFGQDQTGRSGAKSFRVVDEPRIVRDFQFVNEAVPAGTALALSTLLVHRSEPNRTRLARLNVQLRFDDVFAPESLARNYPDGLYLGESFGASYPEYIV
jgi:ectoine hydroxylase-related dioxygenase (phytanoyl-CoA dioxygenase family)